MRDAQRILITTVTANDLTFELNLNDNITNPICPTTVKQRIVIPQLTVSYFPEQPIQIQDNLCHCRM